VEESAKDVSPDRLILCAAAAWGSFLIPIAMTAVALHANDSIDTRQTTHMLGLATSGFGLSLVLGIASLVGLRRHPGKSTQWIAALGIVESLILGGVIGFGFIFMEGMMHSTNC
jgi:ABC-type Fe3+ transport system permease subunit